MVLCVPHLCSVHRGQKNDPWNWSYRCLRTALRMLHPDPGPMEKRHVISTAEPSLRMNVLSLTPFAHSDPSWTSWRVVSFPFPLFVSSCWLLYFSYLEYVCLFFFPYPYFNQQIYLGILNSCPMPPSWVYNLQISMYNPGKQPPVYASGALLNVNGHLIVHAPSIYSKVLQYG